MASASSPLSPFPKLPSIADLAQSIRAGFSRLLGPVGNFPSDPYIRQGAQYQFTVIRKDGSPAAGWTIQVKAVLGKVYDPTIGDYIDNDVWDDFLGTDDKGQASGVVPFAVQFGGVYQWTIVASDKGGTYRGYIAWNESGFVMYQQGVRAVIDLSTGTNSASTGGTTQGGGTGSGQDKYHSVIFTLMIGGKPDTGRLVEGYLASNREGSWIILAGSKFGLGPTGSEAKIGADGTVSVEFTTALDPSETLRYSLKIAAADWNSQTNMEYYHEFKPGVLTAGLGDTGGVPILDLKLGYTFSGKTGDMAQITSSPYGEVHDGPAVVVKGPGG